MWEQGSKGWDQGSAGRIRDHNHGIHRISSFLGNQAVPFLWDQGPKFSTLLESRIRNLGTEMGSAMTKHTLLGPC